MEIPQNPQDVIQAALRFESEGHRILADAASSASDPLSKATFEFLAEQELKHISTIQSFAMALANEGEFDPELLGSPIDLAYAGNEIKGIFARYKNQYEAAAASPAQPRMEAYQVAMDMERHGHEFYEQAAEKASDELSRRLYHFLAGEEEKHFQIIQDTHDYLKQPDAFQAVEERWMQI